MQYLHCYFHLLPYRLYYPLIYLRLTMQFEPPLGNIFQAYRKATEDVVQWIASTARATGTVGHLFGEDPPAAHRSFLQKLKDKSAARPSVMEKLKGKRRKQTKPTASATSLSTIRISYKTLRELGKAIGKAEDVQVDLNVLVALKGIIHARKGFAT